MDGYTLSRRWFNFAFDEKDCKYIHTALFFWIVELNNRLGWKKEFGLPSNDTCEGLSIGNKNTYLSALRDLEKWGFIRIIQESKNQFSSTIIEICSVNNDTATDTALDTALIQHGYSTIHSIDTIDKQINKETNKQDKPPKKDSKISNEEARKILSTTIQILDERNIGFADYLLRLLRTEMILRGRITEKEAMDMRSILLSTKEKIQCSNEKIEIEWEKMINWYPAQRREVVDLVSVTRNWFSKLIK